MDRLKSSCLAGFGLALLLTSGGCRHLPTRQVPPEPAFSNSAMPPGAPETGFSMNSAGTSADQSAYSGASTNALTPPTGPYGAAPTGNPYGGMPSELGGMPPAGPSQGGLNAPDGSVPAASYNMGQPGSTPSPY